MKQVGALLPAIFLAVTAAEATVIYSIDFSVAGQGSTHDNTGSDPIESSPIAGGNWTLTFGSVATDSTTNEFITVGGVMRVQDWGGNGTVTSTLITVTEEGSILIDGVAETIGGDAFTTTAEGITWFYSLNGGPDVTEFFGGTTFSDSSSGTSVSHTFGSISVEAGDELLVGFTVNVNGANDGVQVDSMSVSFTAIPELAPALLGSMGFLLLLRRRR